jgi:hypothetical protein
VSLSQSYDVILYSVASSATSVAPLNAAVESPKSEAILNMLVAAVLQMDARMKKMEEMLQSILERTERNSSS